MSDNLSVLHHSLQVHNTAKVHSLSSLLKRASKSKLVKGHSAAGHINRTA
jgi:hypothetical protein